MDLIRPNYCINAPSPSLYYINNHKNINSRTQFLASMVQEHKKLSAIRVSSLAAAENSRNGTTTRASRSLAAVTSDTETESKASSLKLGKSSSAMELLDIERGVCVPFRKYSPETVRLLLLLYQ